MSDFTDLFDEWATHSVTVWKRLGKNAHGDVYQTDLQMTTLATVMVEEEQRVVISADGTRVTSNATIYCAAEELDTFNEKARVQLPSGRVALVLSIRKLDVYGMVGHGVVSTT